MYPRRTMSIKRRAAIRTSRNFQRDGIRTLLVNRYQRKFSGKRSPELSKMIGNEVDSLLREKSVNQSQLRALENRLHSLSNSLNKSAVCMKTVESKSKAKEEASKTIVSGAAELPPIRNGKMSARNQWTELIEHDLKKLAEEQSSARLKEREKKRRVREDLLKQMNEKIERKRLAKSQEQTYHRMVMEHEQVLEEQEKKRMAEGLEKMRQERQLRDRQLREEQAKKKKLEEEERSASRRQLDKIKSEIEVENLRHTQFKKLKLQEATALIKENEKLKMLHDKRKLEEQEEDKKLLQEQIKQMEIQERKHAEEMKAKEVRIQALVKYAEEHHVKDEAKKRILEEQRFINKVLEREKKEEQEERRRKQDCREKERRNTEHLRSQVDEKRKRQHEEVARSREMAECCRRKDEACRVEERERTARLRKKYRQWHNDVLQQVTERKEKSGKEVLMDDRELLINKKLLDELSTIN